MPGTHAAASGPTPRALAGSRQSLGCAPTSQPLSACGVFGGKGCNLGVVARRTAEGWAGLQAALPFSPCTCQPQTRAAHLEGGVQVLEGAHVDELDVKACRVEGPGTASRPRPPGAGVLGELTAPLLPRRCTAQGTGPTQQCGPTPRRQPTAALRRGVDAARDAPVPAVDAFLHRRRVDVELAGEASTESFQIARRLCGRRAGPGQRRAPTVARRVAAARHTAPPSPPPEGPPTGRVDAQRAAAAGQRRLGHPQVEARTGARGREGHAVQRHRNGPHQLAPLGARQGLRGCGGRGDGSGAARAAPWSGRVPRAHALAPSNMLSLPPGGAPSSLGSCSTTLFSAVDASRQQGLVALQARVALRR
jgi:hypothetical protein